MARKKKNAEPVRLSQEELIPSVIGVIDEKATSNWIILPLFGILIAFIIALPTITNYFNGEGEILDNPVVTPGNVEDPSNDPTEEVEFHKLTNDLVVTLDGMTFQNFVLTDDDISFQIVNDANAKDYLVTHHYYLELYDNNQMLLQRIKLPNKNISKGNSESYTSDLSIAKSTISQIVIDEKTTDDYPAINLKKEEDGTYSLACTKGTRKISYEFTSEQKLKSIADTVNYVSTADNYNVLLADYRQMTSKYNALEGVTSNIVEIGNGFTVTTTLDLSIVDFTNRTVLNTLDEEAYYGKDTEGKVVYFELSAMNYKCSM